MLLFKKVMFNKTHNFNLLSSLNTHMETSHGTPINLYNFVVWGICELHAHGFNRSTKDEYI